MYVGTGAGTGGAAFFGRNEKGEINIYEKPKGELWELSTKVKVEVRMCAGVAKIEKNGNIQGLKTKLLD